MVEIKHFPCRATQALPVSKNPKIRHSPVMLLEGNSRDEVNRKRYELIEELIAQGSLHHDDVPKMDRARFIAG